MPLNPDPTTEPTADPIADPIADSELLRPLVALVVKQGVGLGGLTEPEREQALAVVWAALPTAPCSERAINDALREALAGPARFIDTDHVELRRWLVDTGWLSRDGFGREYRAVALAALPPGRQPLARALVAAGPQWPQAQRQRFEAERAARRARWAAAQAGSPGAPG